MHTNKKPILEVKHISKSFPGVKALSQVDFTLYPGEVHILAGENGAGKSTLVKCILGIYPVDEGEICYKGNKVSFSSPLEAIQNGIAAVHQELTMIPYLNAAQNIFFQREPRIPGTPILDEKKMNREARALLDQLHCGHIPLKKPVKYLGVANQQMIEIAKAMSVKPDVLIFDEPTATLSSREVDFLFEQIRVLKEEGIAILYISHRMGEFEKIGDRVTILRDGQWIHTASMKEITQDDITGYMVGREFASEKLSEKTNSPGEEILSVENLSDPKGKVTNCSFKVCRGEIVGISGLLGSGRTELMNLIFGTDRPVSGKVYLRGKDVTGYAPKDMVKEGLGFLTEDRKAMGLAIKAPLSWNMIAASLTKYFPKGILSEKENEKMAREYVEQLSVATSDVRKRIEELSGGNQQKVALGKWLAADTEVLIFDEPTRGVDIGAKMEIYRLMKNLAREGKAIIMVSSEMEEILSLSDRVYIMKQGKITGELSQDEFNMDDLGRRMLQRSQMQEAEDCCTEEKKVSRQKQEASTSVFHVLSKLPPAFYITLLLILLFGYTTNNFYTFSNLSNILSQAAPLMAVACGQTLIILIQGTDLSLGSMMSLMTVFWISILNLGIPMILSIPCCLLLGVILGCMNGWIVARAMIPVFIVTLGSQNIFRSAGLLLCQSQTIYFDHPIFRSIGKGKFLGLTGSVWIAIACFLLTLFLLRKTSFGMRIKGLGGNEEALHFAGSKVKSCKLGVFAYAGLMAAVAGILLCCRIESGNPNSGAGMEFNAIAAVLLGGTSMREGRGGVEGTVFGVLLIQVLKSGLMQTGISSIYQNAIIGIVVLLAIILDAILKNREEG